ncbi:MAG: hypothetical protein K2Q24_07445 [Chitinophagaceae bacterium]|nr:hypothetical protein [Chitinophagaceae bacterium]
MNKNWNNFCALACLFLTFSLTIQAQSTTDSAYPSANSTKILTVFPFFPAQPTIFLVKQPTVQVNLGSPFSHWGIMCIGEYKLEKKTGIPFRFRLGSLDYVNKLEGKY